MIGYENLIFACLEDLIPHHVDVVGEGPTRRLIADMIQGKSPQLKKAEHGRHVDLGVPIGEILSFGQLVISVLSLYLQLRSPNQTTKQPKGSGIQEPIAFSVDAKSDEEDFVRVVVEKYGPGSPQTKIAVTFYQKARQSICPSEQDR